MATIVDRAAPARRRRLNLVEGALFLAPLLVFVARLYGTLR